MSEKNLNLDFLKDVTLVIISIVGFLGGIPTILKVFKKKPKLEIDNVKMEIHPIQNADYLNVSFDLWNGKKWWKRFRISEANSPQVKGVSSDKNSTTISHANHLCDLIPPRKREKVLLKFAILGKIDTISLHIKSNNTRIEKDLKIVLENT